VPGLFVWWHMIEDNWDLIQGDGAHAIEVLNYSNQVNVIEALVHLFMHHNRGPDGSCTHSPGAMILCEFHRTGTLFLLNRPGQFREGEVVVRRGDGTVIHTPPTKEEIGAHLDTFFATLAKEWAERSAQEIAAFCLWMINWVHPFKNGNGRTARAFAYACLSLKLGFVLPGTTTVIDLIMQNREQYQAALKAADLAFEAGNAPNLGPMIDFVDGLLAQQFASVMSAS